MTEQEQHDNLEQRQDLGPYVKHVIGSWDNNQWFIGLRDEYVEQLQPYVGNSAELVVIEVQYTYAGEDTTGDSKTTWIRGKISAINPLEIQILADSGETEYSDSIEKRKLDPGLHEIQYGSGVFRDRVYSSRTRINKLIVDGRNILPDAGKPN